MRFLRKKNGKNERVVNESANKTEQSAALKQEI